MYKIYAYWSAPKPEDTQAFEEYYKSTHCPRAAAVPELKRLVTSKLEGFEGGAPKFYRMAEMGFDNKEAMARSATSPEWAAMRACSGDIISRFGVTLTVDLGEEDVWNLNQKR
jgi:uncharacterized protein (TIGR02118 family)